MNSTTIAPEKPATADSGQAVPGCPCCSAKEFTVCCEPILSGKRKAQTAEELLRARYTAFAKGEIDFILGSHHSRTRGDVKREEIEEWSQNSEWLGLQVVQVEGGQATDDKATLSFCARYKPKENEQGKIEEHWEQSYFEKENGDWKFLDAQGIHLGTFKRTEPKIGRNDPCPCKSGKKFKKCCGTAA